MFFTLTFPNKVHLETKPKKLKSFFFASSSHVLHETAPVSAPSVPTRRRYLWLLGNSSVHPSRGRSNLGSVLKVSMGISAYNHTRITAASKIALRTPFPFPAKLLRERCGVSPLTSILSAIPAPPLLPSPLRELSALPD